MSTQRVKHDEQIETMYFFGFLGPCVGCVGFLVESTADYVWASWNPTGILCYVNFVAIVAQVRRV